MPARLRQVVLPILILVIAAGLFWLINNHSDSSNPANSSIGNPVLPDGFDQLLTGKEFSDVIFADGLIVAGGATGLYQINPISLSVTEILLNGNSYQSVRALNWQADELWVGHESGLSIYQGWELMRQIGKTDGLPDPRVQDILRLDEKTAYVATYSGLAVIEPSGVRWLTAADGLPGTSIKVLMQDSRNNIWIGSYDAAGGGAAVFSDTSERYQVLTIEDGLAHNSITAISETADGQILIGSGVFSAGGASILEYRNNRWQIIRNLGLADGLAGEKVRQIYIDPSNRIWFCSEYDGVAIQKAGTTIHKLTEDNGLSDNEVKQVAQDAEGHFWLATRSGLTRISADALK